MNFSIYCRGERLPTKQPYPATTALRHKPRWIPLMPERYALQLHAEAWALEPSQS